jgi:mono/diheme cytochrome c family protein
LASVVTRRNKIAAILAVGLVSFLVGCRQDMHDQPKFFPLRGTAFYADGRSVRPQVPNTVARGQLHVDSYFYTGMVDGKEGEGLPFPVTRELLARGQERYNVYCTPCHSRVGNGGGMIVQRGYSPAANLQGDRLRAAGLGHFFNVITNGYGSMPDYAAQLTPIDRWAVAAYIRALQLSQGAQRTDAPANVQIKPLVTIAVSQGLPESYAAEWDVSAPAEIPSNQPASAKPAGAEPTAPASTADLTAKPEKKKPLTVADIKAGQALYAKNCQVCHTPELTGRPPIFPSLINVVAKVGEAHVRKNIQKGSPPMPAFPNLTDKELDQLVAFLTDPSKAGHPAPPPVQ